MSQVTIYLRPELADKMRQAAEAEGLSQSKWVARLVASRLATEWPSEVRNLVGAWPDFPEAEDLRRVHGPDLPRQPL